MKIFGNLFGGNKKSTPVQKSILSNKGAALEKSNTVDQWMDSCVSRNTDLTPEQAYNKIAPVRNAISKIADNVARCRWRIFNDKDQEIIGGSLFDLCQRPNKSQSQYQFTQEVASWFLLTSEMAIFPVAQNAIAKPSQLKVWDPTRLTYSNPVNPKDIDDIQTWLYQYYNGTQVYVPSQQLIYGKTFSPGSIRGVSSIVSGTNEINTYFQATRYTRSFFANDGVPAVHVKFPQGMGKEAKEQAVDEWANLFNTSNNGAFKTYFSDYDVQIEIIESNLKNSFASDLIKLELSTIYQIWSLPPIISGDWANAKYDSADVQLETFADNVLFPIIRNITDLLQMQLVDRYSMFWNLDAKVDTGGQISQSMKKKLNIQKANSPSSSGLYLVLDIDTLPIAAKIQRGKIDSAIKFVQSGLGSPRVATEFYNIDLPMDNNPAADAVFIPSTVTEYQKPVQAPAPQKPSSPAEDVAPSEDEAPVDVTSDAEKSYSKKISRFVNEFRLLSLKNHSMKLRDVDALLSSICPDDNVLKNETRSIFARIKEITKSEASNYDKSQMIKTVFNSIPKQRIREISKEYHNGVNNDKE